MTLNHAVRRETSGQPRVLLIYPAVRLARRRQFHLRVTCMGRYWRPHCR